MTVELVRKSASATNGGELDSSVTQVIPGAKTFSGAVAVSGNLSASGAIAFDPTLLTDVQATKMGLKTYLHGGSYVSGLAPTCTGTISAMTTTRGAFIPYQMQNGDWRLKFNIKATAAAVAFNNFTIAGILSVSVDQVVTMYQDDSGTTYTTQASAGASSNTVSWRVSAATSSIILSGDIELASKPSWAY